LRRNNAGEIENAEEEVEHGKTHNNVPSEKEEEVVEGAVVALCACSNSPTASFNLAPKEPESHLHGS
jgi:hypothetical protein